MEIDFSDYYSISQYDADTWVVIYKYSGRVVSWCDSREQADHNAEVCSIQRIICSNIECGTDQYEEYGETVQAGLDAHYVNVIDTLGLTSVERDSNGWVAERDRLAHYKATAKLYAAFKAECAARDIDWS